MLINKWVYRTKVNQNNEIEKCKARLVACGYSQEQGADYNELFSPVARYETIITLLAAATNEEMLVHKRDVISAHLQVHLHDEVYMEQAEMFVQIEEEEKVCKFFKSTYGLKQSGREWYSFLLKIVGKCSPVEPCVYIFDKDEDRVIIVVYVNDLIIASKRIDNIIQIKVYI